MAVILRGGVGGSLMCGGSLISPEFVVTAGHCCDGQSASRLGVRVGNHHLYEDDPDQMDIPVKRVILHENYDSWTVQNDICLLELDGQANFGSDVIGGITLPDEDQDYEEGTECVVSGWGTTAEGGSLGKVLMKVTVFIVSDEECGLAYGASEISESMLCAGVSGGGKDSCQGDSGGPLMTSSGGDGVTAGQNYLQIGVVSWGNGCAEPNFPGVYARA